MARGFSIARPKVSLTEVGKAYYDRCTQILSDLEQADEFAGALQSTPRGTLRIHTATHIVPFIAPVAAEFLASYPDAKVDLTVGERTIDLIDERFDLAIRLALPPDSSLIVRSLATWRHVLCSSPAYLEKYGLDHRSNRPNSQNAIGFAIYSIRVGDDWHFVDRKGAPASVRVSGNLVTNSGETVRSAALQGVGISLAAGFLVAEDLEQGRLVRLLPQCRPVEFSMNAVYPHRHHLSAKVRSYRSARAVERQP